MSSSLNKLSAASQDRKARLAHLRSLKRKQPNDEAVAPEPEARSPSQPADEPHVAHKHLSGRNYDFETRGPKLGFDAMPNEGLEQPTLEEQAAEVEAEVHRQAAEDAQDDKGVDLFKLQPKKPNWDLKRNLESRMAVLNVRTDNAIAKLVRDRISAAQEAARQSAAADADAVGMDGVALVEGLRVRQQEEEEEEERARREEEALAT